MAKKNLKEKLRIPNSRVKEINDFLLSPRNKLTSELIKVVNKFGGPDKINKKARQARNFDSLMKRLEKKNPGYVKDIKWIMEQRDNGKFISKKDFQKKALRGKKVKMNRKNAVTLEVSALQYFPFLVAEVKEAIKKKELMPGRYIRVRNMKEQVDDGDILAVAAAMQVVGATYVETLDTKGTDGSNCHLGGPETITGYFGGVGQPNEHAIQWVEEFLHYHTEYGVNQVLNVNPGTVIAAYMLHKLGVDCEFKISVYMGNDNPYSVFWTLMTAKLFSRADGTTPLIGFNLSNSVNNDTIKATSDIRKALGFEEVVRIEHHITETWKSIVVQPYDRLNELVEISATVPNISAKHEGGTPAAERKLKHPSDILEYFLPKKDINKSGLMPALERNYIEKHRAANRTARALAKAGIDVVCAWNLH